MLLLPLIATLLVAGADGGDKPDTHLSVTSPSQRPLRLAVYDLEVEGIDARTGKVVTDALVNELRKLDHTSVIAMDEVRAMLDAEAQKQLVGCSDTSCLAEIADSLGVDGLVIGKLLTVGDSHVFALKRIDQRTAAATSTSQNLTPANGEEFLAAVGPAVAELFKDVPLRKGVTRGVAPELALRLNPPPLDPWVFWTGVGVTSTAVVVAGGAFALNQAELAANAELRAKKTLSFVDLARSSDRVDAYATASWIAVGAACVFAAATAVAVPFTDFDGVRAKDGAR